MTTTQTGLSTGKLSTTSDTACLISYPFGTDLEKKCPRCSQPAGDHPAPQQAGDPDLTIFERTTLRAITEETR